MNKAVVKRQSLTQQIQSIIIGRIVDGHLLPGDRLKELQIAEEFGTSQAPVREAIRSLQALGYVKHKPHVGAIVKTFTVKEIEEAYQVREALEGHCLILAEIQESLLLSELKEQLQIMETAVATDDIRTFTQADNLFHRAIIEGSNNLRMLEIWDSLKIQLQIIATHVEAAMPLAKLYALHPPIVDALAKGQRTLSVKCLTQHYRDTAVYWKL